MSDADRIRALPLWQGPIEIVPLGGGLSNRNYKVTGASGACVVRLGEDLPFHHVFRDREAAAARAAHAAGLSPALRHAEGGVMVFDFLAGRSLGADDVRARISELAGLLARVHRDVAGHLRGAASAFWVFHVLRDYAARLAAAGADPAVLGRFLAVAADLEAAQVPLPVVFGHHDLLPANILDVGGRLQLIDWEYGGFGTAMFDLANLAANAGFEAEDDEALLAAYFGGAPDPATRRAFAAMKVASALRETMWSMVGEHEMTTPGVDFSAYTEDTRARFEAVLAAFEKDHR